MLPLRNRLPLRTNRKATEALAKSSFSPYFTFLSARPLQRADLPSRFAVILSKKISNLAVTRNLLRRQILASIHESLAQIKPGFDVIVLPKKAIIGADYIQIKAEIEKLLKQSGLL